MALVHKQKALHAYCERSINQSAYRKNKRSEEYFHPYKFTPFIFSFYFFHIFILEQTYSFWFHRDISFSPFLLPSLAFQSFCFFIIFLIALLFEHSKVLFFGHGMLFIFGTNFSAFGRLSSCSSYEIFIFTKWHSMVWSYRQRSKHQNTVYIIQSTNQRMKRTDGRGELLS